MATRQRFEESHRGIDSELEEKRSAAESPRQLSSDATEDAESHAQKERELTEQAREARKNAAEAAKKADDAPEEVRRHNEAADGFKKLAEFHTGEAQRLQDAADVDADLGIENAGWGASYAGERTKSLTAEEHLEEAKKNLRLESEERAKAELAESMAPDHRLVEEQSTQGARVLEQQARDEARKVEALTRKADYQARSAQLPGEQETPPAEYHAAEEDYYKRREASFEKDATGYDQSADYHRDRAEELRAGGKADAAGLAEESERTARRLAADSRVRAEESKELASYHGHLREQHESGRHFTNHDDYDAREARYDYHAQEASYQHVRNKVLTAQADHVKGSADHHDQLAQASDRRATELDGEGKLDEARQARGTADRERELAALDRARADEMESAATRHLARRDLHSNFIRADHSAEAQTHLAEANDHIRSAQDLRRQVEDRTQRGAGEDSAGNHPFDSHKAQLESLAREHDKLAEDSEALARAHSQLAGHPSDAQPTVSSDPALTSPDDIPRAKPTAYDDGDLDSCDQRLKEQVGRGQEAEQGYADDANNHAEAAQKFSDEADEQRSLADPDTPDHYRERARQSRRLEAASHEVANDNRLEAEHHAYEGDYRARQIDYHAERAAFHSEQNEHFEQAAVDHENVALSHDEEAAQRRDRGAETAAGRAEDAARVQRELATSARTRAEVNRVEAQHHEEQAEAWARDPVPGSHLVRQFEYHAQRAAHYQGLRDNFREAAREHARAAADFEKTARDHLQAATPRDPGADEGGEAGDERAARIAQAQEDAREQRHLEAEARARTEEARLQAEHHAYRGDYRARQFDYHAERADFHTQRRVDLEQSALNHANAAIEHDEQAAQARASGDDRGARWAEEDAEEQRKYEAIDRARADENRLQYHDHSEQARRFAVEGTERGASYTDPADFHSQRAAFHLEQAEAFDRDEHERSQAAKASEAQAAEARRSGDDYGAGFADQHAREQRNLAAEARAAAEEKRREAEYHTEQARRWGREVEHPGASDADGRDYHVQRVAVHTEREQRSIGEASSLNKSARELDEKAANYDQEAHVEAARQASQRAQDEAAQGARSQSLAEEEGERVRRDQEELARRQDLRNQLQAFRDEAEHYERIAPRLHRVAKDLHRNADARDRLARIDPTDGGASDDISRGLRGAAREQEELARGAAQLAERNAGDALNLQASLRDGTPQLLALDGVEGGPADADLGTAAYSSNGVGPEMPEEGEPGQGASGQMTEADSDSELAQQHQTAVEGADSKVGAGADNAAQLTPGEEDGLPAQNRMEDDRAGALQHSDSPLATGGEHHADQMPRGEDPVEWYQKRGDAAHREAQIDQQWADRHGELAAEANRKSAEHSRLAVEADGREPETTENLTQAKAFADEAARQQRLQQEAAGRAWENKGLAQGNWLQAQRFRDAPSSGPSGHGSSAGSLQPTEDELDREARRHEVLNRRYTEQAEQHQRLIGSDPERAPHHTAAANYFHNLAQHEAGQAEGPRHAISELQAQTLFPRGAPPSPDPSRPPMIPDLTPADLPQRNASSGPDSDVAGTFRLSNGEEVQIRRLRLPDPQTSPLETPAGAEGAQPHHDQPRFDALPGQPPVQIGHQDAGSHQPIVDDLRTPEPSGVPVRGGPVPKPFGQQFRESGASRRQEEIGNRRRQEEIRRTQTEARSLRREADRLDQKADITEMRRDSARRSRFKREAWMHERKVEGQKAAIEAASEVPVIGDLTHLPGMGPLAEALVKLPGVGDDRTLQLGKAKRQAEARAAKMKEDHDKFQSEAREQRKTAAEKRRSADQCDQRIRELQSAPHSLQGMVVSRLSQFDARVT